MLKTNHSYIQTVRCVWIWNNSITLMILIETIIRGKFPRSQLHGRTLLPSLPWPVGRRLPDSEIAHNAQGGKNGSIWLGLQRQKCHFFLGQKCPLRGFWESVSLGAWPHPVSGPVPLLSKEPPPRCSAGPQGVWLQEVNGAIVNNFLKDPTVHVSFMF